MAVRTSEFLKPRFIAFAHRGGSFLPANLGIENTMLAFENAAKLGFNYMETDVHVTRDGHLVAFHDDHLARVTDFEGKPGDLTLAELKQLRVGRREEIPTLDELLDAFPSLKFNIDIKNKRATLPLSKAIDQHNAHDRVCVGSFNDARLRLFRKLQPTVTTAASPSAVALLRAGQVRTAGDVYQVPIRKRIGMINWDIVTPTTVKLIHKAGKKIHVWTIDDDTTMHRLIDWGVDGIMTDRPELLKSVLRMRGMWSTR
ncbi:MAG: glycerophosphodiester phosphodiesterase [Propionibacteriaceae bacterium]|nr:glycerophosphodiester phosphodiesterase [Propionibacteriaceae bacterium]